MHWRRRASFRITTAWVLAAVTSMLLEPPRATATTPAATPGTLYAPWQGAGPATTEGGYSAKLAIIHDILKELTPAARYTAPASPTAVERTLRAVGPDLRVEERADRFPLSAAQREAKLQSLQEHYQELLDLEEEAERSFEAMGRQIREANLPAPIQERQEKALNEYRRLSRELHRLMDVLESAPAKEAALEELGRFFAAHDGGRAPVPIDPEKLPLRSPDSEDSREPFESERELRGALFWDQGVRVAQAGSLSGIALPSENLPAEPSSRDLAPTEDVQITQAIRDRAVDLEGNPLLIYNWVRNNVDYVPTYGSIQGSELTLQTERGNAFDTASLLIALLRASEIPARYVYGTIEVPVEEVMNWVGGVSSPQAAMELLGQAGVPNLGVRSGGRIQSIRMEHVWVEAFVDYVPSRGAVNRSPQTWVPMDASFKQYVLNPGMSIRSNVPFDAAAFLETARQSTEINEDEGWVRSANPSLPQQAFLDYQARIEAYINSQNPDATDEDVLGTRSIVEEERPILMGTLPYPTIAVGARMQALPDHLRHGITVRLYASDLERAAGNPSLSFPISLPALNTRRLGVTYRPAGAADAAVIENARVANATSLPAYLIEVVPVLQLEGLSVGEGSPVGMGEAQFWEVELRDPRGFFNETSVFSQTAGDEIVFSVNGSGIGPEAVVERFLRVPDESAAENLHKVALSYWTEIDFSDSAFARELGVVSARLPSIAGVKAPLTVQYFFGIPRSALYLGRELDAKRILSAVAAPNDDLARLFRRQSGLEGSYLEASVFNELFTRPQDRGVSAAQLLSDANKQGIPIHTIDAGNAPTAIPMLQVSAEVRADIEGAVAAGHAVTIPRRSPDRPDFEGTGYVIIDPETGAGAYRISGGLNGGGVKDCAPGLAPPIEAKLTPSAVLAFARTSVSRALVTQVVARLALAMTMAGVFAPVAGPVAIVVVVSLVIIMAVYFAKLDRLERECEGRPDGPDCECKKEPKPPQCECQFTQRDHLGENRFHNACADQPVYNAFPTQDTCVTPPGGTPKCFDAFTPAGRQVYEMKTYNCGPHVRGGWCKSTFRQNRDKAEMLLEAAIAKQCNLTYRIVVGHPQAAQIVNSWGIAPVILDVSGKCLQP